ncbi:MAG: hypothetical protein ACRDN0_28630 [Trebonia sp.]
MTAMLLAPARATIRSSTPVALRSLLAALVLLSLAWGAFGGWVASEHSSAANAALTADEPLSQDASQMYQSIADADVTITTAFLASSQPALAPIQRYQADITTASADIARLRAAGGDPGARHRPRHADQRPAGVYGLRRGRRE